MFRRIKQQSSGPTRTIKETTEYCTEWRCVCLFVCVFVWFIVCLFLWLCSPARVMPPRHKRFRDHTQRRATVGRTHLDEWSASRRDLYLTTHNRQTSIPRRDSNPRSQQASGLRPRGHWDPRLVSSVLIFSVACTNYEQLLAIINCLGHFSEGLALENRIFIAIKKKTAVPCGT
jgi:hypothetical protein